MSQEIPLAAPLVEVKRGSITESRHRGHIVVVEPDGNIIAYAGALETVTFLRMDVERSDDAPVDDVLPSP